MSQTYETQKLISNFGSMLFSILGQKYYYAVCRKTKLLFSNSLLKGRIIIRKIGEIPNCVHKLIFEKCVLRQNFI